MNDLTAAHSLPVVIQAGLNARIAQLLQRPLIAHIPTPEPVEEKEPVSEIAKLFASFDAASRSLRTAAKRKSPWRFDGDVVKVTVDIDYDDRWRGYERDILDMVDGCIEGQVVLLTDAQRALLEKSPKEFMELQPAPRSVELVGYRVERVGGQERVVELTVAEAPEASEQIRHIAIIENLIPLQRQIAGVQNVVQAASDSPLVPLRVLLGLASADALAPAAPVVRAAPLMGEKLDEFQAECIAKALSTPHFALIQGPPGSGKTTVIGGIIRRAVDKGMRVLVVSPTHVAVDNVVEKLVPDGRDTNDKLAAHSLPVRYSARKTKLSRAALAYWVSAKTQHRAGTLAKRLEAQQRAHSTVAAQLYRRLDESLAGVAPLSAAIDATTPVFCGTPIGLLSCDALKTAAPGSFDLLIVDEVSKLTLPEFLAIAVMAKRWVLVGDPAQLPPFNNGAENGCTLDGILDARLELACSLAGLIDAVPPQKRGNMRIAVVVRDRLAVAAVLKAQLADLDWSTVKIKLCEPAGLQPTIDAFGAGSVDILVERGLTVPRPAFASGARLVEERQRGGAMLHDVAFQVFHDWHWAERAGMELMSRGRRKGLAHVLPNPGALRLAAPEASHAALQTQIATTYAVNTVSVYDWLAGFPTASFDVSPLTELAGIMAPLAEVRRAVKPLTGVLRRQYRMHSSISRVPRELFYFGEALMDGKPDAEAGTRVRLLQVDSRQSGEENPEEAEAIVKILRQVAMQHRDVRGERPLVLLITPYRKQEKVLQTAVDKAGSALDSLEVEVCTLDRCQGREAAYVFISLTRNRSTPFLDAPKRWNVALTRAKEGLFIVGDVAAFRSEAQRARSGARQPRMSLLARIIESYDNQGGV